MYEKIKNTLQTATRFCITTHVRPDGDAIGSQLALGLFLQKLGKRVTMINQDETPYNLSWLPQVDSIKQYNGTVRQLERMEGADAMIIVDTNAQNRIGKLGHFYRQSQKPRMLIDHHTCPETWFDIAWVQDNASSTGEMIFDLIMDIAPDALDANMATALYTAIVTDTGSFRYSSVTPKVHRTIAELMERTGIQSEPIHAAIYDTRTVNGMQLLSRALDSITMLMEGRLGYMVISRKMMNEVRSEREDSEGFVNYVMSIKGVEVGLIFTETEKGTKVSFRSKGKWAINGWAQELGGGGHRNASGAFIRKPLEIVIRKVLEKSQKYLDVKAFEPQDLLVEIDQQHA